MAIAFDAATNGGWDESSLTFPHTTSGNDRILFVYAVAYDSPDGDVLTGITYGGVAMTPIDKKGMQATVMGYLYYLINPATDENDVIVSSSSADYLQAGAVSYTGAKQSGQPDASTTALSTDTSVTTTLTTVADNSWTVIGSHQATGVGAGTTKRVDISPTITEAVIADSNGAITPAGSTSLVTTFTSSASQARVMASFAPAAEATTTSNFFLLF